MKKSIDTDKQSISKIIEYITDMKDSFHDYNIKSSRDLKNSKYAKYTNTQLITNIFELKKKLQDDTLLKLSLFNDIKLKITRHIASHDYSSLDFDIFYKRCKQLIDQKVIDELEEVLSNDND